MSLIAKSGGSGNRVFALAPAGFQPGVCVDVIDEGMVKNEQYGKLEHKVRLVFQLAETITEESLREAAALKGVELTEDDIKQVGKRFLVRSRQYTLSLHENAALSKDLTGWRGKPFSAADRKGGFDLESLIGVNGMFNIVHNPAKDDPSKIFANIAALAPLSAAQAKKFGVELLEPQDYTRVKDRAATTGKPANGGSIPVDEN